MIVIAFLILGGIGGAVSAKRRLGNRLDMLQYAAVYAIVGALGGLVITIVLEKMI